MADVGKLKMTGKSNSLTMLMITSWDHAIQHIHHATDTHAQIITQ